MTNNNDDDFSDISDAMDDFDQDDTDLDSDAGSPLTRSRGSGSSLKKLVLPAVILVAAAGAGGWYLTSANQPKPYVVETTEPQPAQTAETAPPEPPQPVAFTSETPAPPVQSSLQQDSQLSQLENEVLETEAVPRGPEDAVPPPAPDISAADTAAAPVEVASADAHPPAEMPVPEPSAPESGAEAAAQPQILGDSPPESGQPVEVAPSPVVETTAAPPPMPVAPDMPVPAPPVAVPAQGQTIGDSVPAVPGSDFNSTSETVTGDSSVPLPDPVSAGPEGPDAYYDSRLDTPTGPLADAVGPRKVDPTQEPASKLVIADKTYDGSDVEAQLVAANRALDLGRYESAAEMFDNLYKRNNRDPRILMGRAIAQQKSGQDELAIMSYEALLEIVPDNTNAVVNLMGLIQKQYPAVAQRRLLDLQAKYPGNPGIAAQLGMTFAQMGNNAEALRFLGMASGMERTKASHLYNMAVITDRMGDTSRAIGYYQQALEIDAVYGGGRSIPRASIYDRLAALRAR